VHRRKLLIIVTLAACSASVLAQQRYTFKDNKYVVEGAQLPKYLLVQAMFEQAYRRHQWGKDSYESFLRQLQIVPATPAASWFTEATLKAHEISGRVLDMRPHVRADPVVWDDLQQRFLRQQVIDIRKTYRRLQSQFKQTGVAFTGVDKYIEKTVRSSMNFTSFPDPPVRTLEIMDSFEDQDGNEN
jgi:hypothetical protein